MRSLFITIDYMQDCHLVLFVSFVLIFKKNVFELTNELISKKRVNLKNMCVSPCKSAKLSFLLKFVTVAL